MTGVFWDSISNLEAQIDTLEKKLLKKDKGMSEICFWINNDKSIVIDMSQIVGILRLDKPISCGNRVCEFAVYTSIEKDVAFPITKKEHLSLIEALQETYDYCEMEDDEDTPIVGIAEAADPFENKIKW